MARTSGAKGISMRDLADRVEIAAVLVAAQALSACVGDVDDPRWGTGQERLVEDVWTITDTGDFNADGANDLLWNDAGKSKTVIWLMSATDVLSPRLPISGPPGNAWIAAWATDFNADGMADVRWCNDETLESVIYLMTGAELLFLGPTFPGPLGDGWERVTWADFNADGMFDLLWRNTSTHATAVWLMNGTALLLPGPQITSPLGHEWISSTAGDFDADGMADVLWANTTTGSVSVGLMNATAPLLQGPVIPHPPGDGWRVVIASDFDADGMADVLWYNPTTRVITVWLMAGTHLLLAGPNIPAPPGDGWRAVIAGDFDNNDTADVIWENPETNRFAIWLMAGTQVLLRGAEIPGPTGP
jgi:hypothetical protein